MAIFHAYLSKFFTHIEFPFPTRLKSSFQIKSSLFVMDLSDANSLKLPGSHLAIFYVGEFVVVIISRFMNPR